MNKKTWNHQMDDYDLNVCSDELFQEYAAYIIKKRLKHAVRNAKDSE